MVCVHMRSGDVQKTPYRSYEEARYVADLFVAASRCGQTVTPPADTPFLYVFPPDGDIARIEVVEG